MTTPQTKHLLIGEWAKREGLSREQVRDMARKGRLRKYVTIQKCVVERLMLPADLYFKDVK